MNKRRFTRAVSIGLAAAVLAACSSAAPAESDSSSESPAGSQSSGAAPAGGPTGFNAAAIGVVNPSDATGGTIKAGTSSSCDNFDPATTYGGTCWYLHRLLSRTLVGYRMSGVPDHEDTGSDLRGDLATGLGETNEDNTQWTYQLREGVKFADGTPITSTDIKYAFERQYALDVISGGPAGYYLCLLDTCDDEGTPTYLGPYEDPDGGLDSIETPDERTIVFNLNQPFGDWDFLMALPSTAPVPAAADKGSQYGAGTNLVASGPYLLESVTPKQGVVLVRNPEWSADTDEIRRALVDRVEVTVLSNIDDLDSRMKTGALDFSLDGGVHTTFQSEIINDPALKENADEWDTNGLTMLILYPSDPALADVHCRRAVAYALDKRDMLMQFGGNSGGAYAATLLPPGIPGYDESANRYPSGDDWTGDLDKAREELAACGKPDGFSTTMAYSNFGADPALFASAQTALGRVGIELRGVQLDESTAYQTLSTPPTVQAQNIGIGTMGWIPDYPSANGFLSLLVDASRYNGTSSSTNFVGLNDPAIQDLVKKAAVSSTEEQAEVYRQMDAATMETALYIPVTTSKALYYRSPKLTNVEITTYMAYYDLVNIGIQQ